jgi:integrase
VINLKITKTKLKVNDLFTNWLAYIEALRKPATYNQYRDIYTKHIKPEIGSRKLSTITHEDIQAIIFKMNKTTKKTRKKLRGEWVEVDTGERMSTWTMKHARKVMNGAFGKAVKDKLIPVNPVQDIEIPQKQAKERKTLTHDELVILYKQLERSRWIWSAKFMLVTGIRRGELLALKWSDIDKGNKRITINKSNSSAGIGDTKTRIHYVPLSNKADEYLKSQKQMLEMEVNPILYDENLKKTNLVFPNKHGVMLRAGSYYTMMARAAKEAGIHASPHMLRHTFVYMNRKKLSLKELQSILGHDESTTTLDIYGDMIDESTDATAKTIDEVFEDIDKDIEKVINLKDRKRKAK